MNNPFIKKTLQAGTVLLMVLLFSCGQGPKDVSDKAYERPDGKAAEAEEAAQKEKITEEALPPVEAPQFEQGMITFLTGEVLIGDGSDWFPAVIGDFVEKEEAVKVEPGGYCEIQFGDTAVARLEENTVLQLNQVDVTPGNSSVDMRVAAGSVMSKVNKLAGGEKYKVRSETSVCGVRGTEFMVSVKQEEDDPESAETTVAVKEGSVSVLPAEADIDTMKEKTQAAGESGKAVEEALKKVEEAAPVVEANQEITVKKRDNEKTAEAMKAVEESLDRIAKGEEADPERAVQEISQSVEKVSEEIRETSEKSRKTLSQENQKALAEMDEIEMLEGLTETAAVAEEAGAEDETAEEEDKEAPKPKLNRISVTVQPRDAVILLNGKEVGRGNVARVYPQNRDLDFLIRKEGYKESRLQVNTSGTSGKSYTIRMEKLPEPEKPETIIIQPEPADAEIFQNGESLGTGAYTAQADPGTALSFEIRKDGYETETLNLDVQEGSGKTHTVALKALPREDAEGDAPEKAVAFQADPGSAEISINGEAEGTGRAEGSWPEGTELTVTASRRGFKTVRQTLTVGADTPASIPLNLEPRPVEHRISVSSGQLIRSVESTGTIAVTADRQGNLAAASLDGRKLWSLSTGNTPNENSRPVVSGGKVFFSGAKEFVIAGLNDGREIYRGTVGSAESHMFGRRVTPLGGQVVYPANEALIIRNASTGTEENRFPIAGGSKMSAAPYGQTLVLADQRGKVLRINRSTGAVEMEIPTGALQPVSLAPTIKDNYAYFAGRKGIAACVDLEAGRKVWEKDVSGGRSLGVYTDLEAGESGVYMYARETLYGFNRADGSQLFSPIGGVTCPPAYSGGKLYYGQGTKLITANAATGRTLAATDMGAPITARPAVSGPTLTAGTASGEVLVVVTEALE